MCAIKSFMLAATLLASAPAYALDGEVIHWWTSESEAAGVKVFAKAFEAEGGVWKDSAIAGGGAARAALLNRITGGNPPAAGQWVIGPVVGDMAEQGLLGSVDSVTMDDMRRDFSPSFIKLMTRDDKVYAVSAGVSGDNWMWINAKVYQDLGLQPPKSWDEFIQQSEKIRAAGIIPLAMGGDSIQEAALFRSVLLGVGGVDVYKKIFLDHDEEAAASEPVIKSFETFQKLKALTDDGLTGRKWNAATSMVIKGQAAMQVVGTWAKGEFTSAGKVPNKDYYCMLAPGNEGYVMSVATMLFPKTADPEQIKAQNMLAAVFNDPKNQVEFAKAQGATPSRRDADLSTLDSCTQTGAAILHDQSKQLPNGFAAFDPDVEGMIRDHIQAVWADPSMPAKKAAEDFAALVGNSQ